MRSDLLVQDHEPAHEDVQKSSTRQSKQIVEQIAGAPCTSFAYPNGSPGDFNEETRREVMAAGYRCAVTTVKSRVTKNHDRFEIPRYILTHNQITLEEFAVEVSGFPTFLRGIKRKLTAQGRRD